MANLIHNINTSTVNKGIEFSFDKVEIIENKLLKGSAFWLD